jgi:hypothetical protein
LLTELPSHFYPDLIAADADPRSNGCDEILGSRSEIHNQFCYRCTRDSRRRAPPACVNSRNCASSTIRDQDWQTVCSTDRNGYTELGRDQGIGLTYTPGGPIGLQHDPGVNLLQARHRVLRKSGHTCAKSVPDASNFFKKR